MSWWRRWSTRRRAAVIVAVVTVVVGSVGAAYAVTGGEDDVAQASPSPTPSTYGPFAPTSTSDTSTASGGADGGTGPTEKSSHGTIVVRINPASGKHPIEVGGTAYEVDTGAKITLGYDDPLCCRLTQMTFDVPAGRYQVIVGSDDDDWEAAWVGQTSGADADRSQARTVEVGPGETVTVDVELIEWPVGERPDSPGFDWGDDDADPTPPSTPAPQPTSTTPATEPAPTP